MEFVSPNCTTNSPSYLSISPPSPLLSILPKRVNFKSKFNTKFRNPAKSLVVRAKALQLSKNGGNSALDQLDIERGICVPFRKYTPEAVMQIFLYNWCCYSEIFLIDFDGVDDFGFLFASEFGQFGLFIW